MVYDWLVMGILIFVLNLYKIVYVIMKNIKKINIYNNLFLMCDDRYDYFIVFVFLRNICYKCYNILLINNKSIFILMN